MYTVQHKTFLILNIDFKTKIFENSTFCEVREHGGEG